MEKVYNNFNFLFKQTGNYIEAEDRIEWVNMGLLKSDYGLAMSWVKYQRDEDGNSGQDYDITYRFIVEPTPFHFLGIIHQEYHIRMYAAQKWKYDKAYTPLYIIYHNKKYWYTELGAPIGEEPGISTNWKRISDSQADRELLDTIHLKMDGYFTPVYSPDIGNFRIIKTGDHQFSVEWIGDDAASYYEIRNYKDELIKEGTVPADGIVSFVTPQDGIYTVAFYVMETMHYAEVYDFTDSEKCFLELMQNVLCECVDCDDCPGEHYERALNFTNIYLLIRDIIYSKSAMAMGLVDDTILRTKYISIMGIALQKLNIMQDSCLCFKDDNDAK